MSLSSLTSDIPALPFIPCLPACLLCHTWNCSIPVPFLGKFQAHTTPISASPILSPILLWFLTLSLALLIFLPLPSLPSSYLNPRLFRHPSPRLLLPSSFYPIQAMTRIPRRAGSSEQEQVADSIPDWMTGKKDWRRQTGAFTHKRIFTTWGKEKEMPALHTRTHGMAWPHPSSSYLSYLYHNARR